MRSLADYEAGRQDVAGVPRSLVNRNATRY
jgi:hypothetical protein